MKHRSLLGDVARFAKGMPERPVQVQEARCVRGNRDLFHERKTYRCHASGFDFPREQSHGPRANGSSGNQQNQIGARLPDAQRDLFDRRHEPPGAPFQTETIVIVGQASDHVRGF